MSGLEGRVSELNARYAGLDAGELLRVVLTQEFQGKAAVISSFGTESAVLLDLVAQVDPATPVIFLDTGKLFDETLDYKRHVERRLGLTDVRVVRPLPAELAQSEGLWTSDHDGCCSLRKVEPLRRAAEPYEALIDGRKRHHGDERASLPAFELGRDAKIKVSPLASWDADHIAEAFEARNLPRHPLMSMGYLSVGCWPCTEPVSDASLGARAGRWAGQVKTECGIHSRGVK